MMNREGDYKLVKELAEGDTVYIFWCEGGGGQVFRTETSYLLYEIPLYGGEEIFVAEYALSKYKDLVDEAWSWT